ncbi:MAG TPA: bifunctional diaminohydroxyphosphoribosylaminopyrimidine deaminase/5-amino-6-(5-phosphoribosylamino)uracil reductase RibD [bacterium]|nr:bifunctional diaminohydroxyphosphoribosylaminopyrimidine deaminase/5-amino-6-(5-phosphoribosylamino)uracil reductase RibD [bacterium]
MTALQYMKRALHLAGTRARYVSPNPRVGAVLVRGGRIVGEGVTQPYGGPHAEIMALRRAGSRARGATLYVTLEPCSHYGKTPPCANAILDAGVRRVVAATGDPNPKVAGKGFRLLRAAGIGVQVGPAAPEAIELNQAFFFSHAQGRPWVTLKAGTSLDGRIAGVTGRSRWITNKVSRQKAHLLRSRADAILVGSGTLLEDDPSLTVRLPGWRRKDGWPLRIVLDSRLRIPLKARVLKGPAGTVLFAAPQAPQAKQRTLESLGARVFRVPSRGKMLSLKAILALLQGLEVRSLLVEGGGAVHASFLEEGLADELHLFVAPKVIGGKAPSWAGGKGVTDPNLAVRLKGLEVEPLAGDLWVHGTF